jgi:biofilm PGA synthesis N-glycosyltransferase PgaC
MPQRLLVVSPVHNESLHIERVARAVAAQTRPPDAWVVVDDASTDDTLGRLRGLERELDFLTVIAVPERSELSGSPDRLAQATEIRAFNAGLRTVDWKSFTHIAKLDGDVELPSEWYATLLARFAANPKLGIVGGDLVELHDGRRRTIPIPRHHVHGAVKLYSVPCFLSIGGAIERLGWDSVDEAYARMQGWKTVSFTDIVAIHHRPLASAHGVLRGRARHGLCAYIAHQSLPWVILRAVKVGRARPVALGGLAFICGYLRGAITRTRRVEDPDLRRFVRYELRARARRALVPAGPGHAR